MSDSELDNSQGGFTIIELMIATTVLSVLLVMVSVIMIGVGNLYYKGINQARVQTAVRTITDETSQQLQLRSSSSAQPLAGKTANLSIEGTTYTVKTYCMGDTRYTYIVGVQRGTSSEAGNPQIPHVLWRDSIPAGSCTTQDPAHIESTSLSGGSELIPPNSRLTTFDLTGDAFYSLNIGVAYGDLDLLTAASGNDVRCKGGTGNQYCATARLQTTVAQRL